METQKFYPGQTESPYKGKVRIVSIIGNYMVAETTNNISAFDVVLPVLIPFKGAILNNIAAWNMRKTEDIVPNCLVSIPHPRVSIWKRTTPFKVEMVIRGYLTGHAWREYQEGKRTLCGVPMPDGMVENQKFPEPIITPTTKAIIGHDEDISKEEIISSGLVSAEDYEKLESYTYALFAKGTDLAAENGLILVDTKYEFGKKEGEIYLIDEVHTPDSSRFFYSLGYEEKLAKGEKQKQLSKEFVREWLMENGFHGRDGDVIPEFTPKIISDITARYKELFLQMGISEGLLPEKDDDEGMYDDICKFLAELN